MDFLFVKDIFLFLIAVLVAFYIPGILLFRQLKLNTNSLVNHFLAIIIGYVFFTFVYFLLSLTNLRILSLTLLIIIFLFWLIKTKINFSLLIANFSIKRISLFFLFLIISLIFSLSMIRSGWVTTEGLKLVSVNRQDGVWNLALIEELRHQFPPQHPSFAGVPLRGYHILYNLSLAGLANIFKISTINLFFHFFPVMIGFFWSGGIYLLIREITHSKLAAYFSVFFTMFGGSFVFLFPSVWHRGISLDDGFGIQQPFLAMQNPSYSSSVVVIIFAIYFFYLYFRSKQKSWLVFVSLFIGVSIGFKTYAGMTLLGSFLVTSLIEILCKKKTGLLFSFIGSLIIALLIFLPLNANYGFLIYYPLWPLGRIMMGNLSFTNWDLKRMYYEEIHNRLGLFKLWSEAFVIFFFGNLGTRILALPIIISWIKKYNTFCYFFLGCLAITTFIPLFFVQPAGGVFNMIQMYWYFLFFMAILAAISLAELIKKIPVKLRYGVIFLVLVLTLPSAAEKLIGSITVKGGVISTDQFESFLFLKNYQSYDSLTLEIPKLANYDLISLNSWFEPSTPVIAAFGSKRTYVGREVVEFPYKEKDDRLNILSEFMKPQTDCNIEMVSEMCRRIFKNSRAILDQQNIAIIYAPTSSKWLTYLDNVQQVFSNKEISIYKVK